MGYEVYRDDRLDRRSGGVAIYVTTTNSELLKAKLNSNLNIKHDASECVWLDIQIGIHKFLLCGLYRGHDSTVDQDNLLFDQIKMASELNTVLIMGDFNYRGVKWPLEECGYLTPREDNFVQWYRTNNLEQLVTQHTRFRQGNQPSFLDLILTNDETLVAQVDYEAPIGKSDHTCLTSTIQLETQNRHLITLRRNFKKADYDKINEMLRSTLPGSIMDQDCAENQFSILATAIMDAIHLHVPQTKLNNWNLNKPWISQKTKDLIRQKMALWNRYRITGQDGTYNEYRKINNLLTNHRVSSRISYENNLLQAGPKKFYSYIRQQITSKVSIPSALRNKLGQIVTQASDISEVFADQFESVYQKESMNQLPLLDMCLRVEESIPEIIFTGDKILQAIKEMKSDSASGPDEIPVAILQKCDLANTLAIIMQTSYDTGTLPTLWKTATVTPIFKKGSKLEPANYRPISLTSVVCKAMEKVIVHHIRKFLASHKIIGEQQHGFCPHRSTVSNLLSCLSSWTASFNAREPIDVIYLDYEKAFDKVPTTRLLQKLEFIGIRGKLLSWIEAFLRQRTLRVRVGETLSDQREIHSGVPQGSVLGPVLYIIYTFDLPRCLQCPVSIFADDTKIFANPLVDYTHLQADLDRVANWSKDWLINLNSTKCTVLHIGNKNPKLTYTLNGTQLQPVKQQTDLGVIITEDLKWENHITTITKKANSFIYLIRKAFGTLTPEMMLKIYKTYVRPLLEYAFQAWSPYFVKDIDQIEKVQRGFTKVPRKLKRLSYEDRLEMLKLGTLKERRERGDLIETFKILNGHYDLPEFEQIFTRNKNSNLRGHSLKLQSCFSHNNPHKHFLTNRVVKAWNKLPEEVVTASNVNQFKNRLDNHSKQ